MGRRQVKAEFGQDCFRVFDADHAERARRRGGFEGIKSSKGIVNLKEIKCTRELIAGCGIKQSDSRRGSRE